MINYFVIIVKKLICKIFYDVILCSLNLYLNKYFFYILIYYVISYNDYLFVYIFLIVFILW